MEAEVTLEDVRTFEVRNGGTRYVIRDAEGKEYTTFRDPIGQRAQELKGRQVRIEYHETQRGNFTNVYVDAVEPLPGSDGGGEAAGDDADEAAWRTAVEAAPWLVGESEPHEEVPPDELYDKLRPLKERVAEDIREGEDPPEE